MVHGTSIPVELKNVSLSYGSQVALRDLSVAFPLQKTTAVIGPSGSGKSTLIQLVNGLVRPDNGVVSVFGRAIDYAQLSGLRRKIGYAVQGTGLFPHLTVERNISLLARLKKWPVAKIHSRIDVLMGLVDLPLDYKSKYPFQLSGGEQQRVGLCRAMILEPKLFLFDEPFGALDPITRSEIHREFIKIQKISPRTTILVTHDLREAIKLADRLIILNQGEMVQADSPDAILANPASEFVEKFVHMQLDDFRK